MDVERVLWSGLKKREIADPNGEMLLMPWTGGMGGVVENHRLWFADPLVVKYLHPYTPYTDDPSRRVSAREFVDYMRDNPFFAYFSIFPTRLDRSVGHIGINAIDYGEREFFLGAMIGEKQWWGKGVATLAVGLLLGYVERLGFKRIKASCLLGNEQSRRVLSKYFDCTGVDGEELLFEKWFIEPVGEGNG